MKHLTRIGALALLTTLLAVSAMPASAQMMHYNLDVTVILTSDELMTGGTVCVTGEVDNICQNIAPGTGSGATYGFTELGAGDHTVTVSGDPYLEAVDYVTLEDVDTSIEISVYMEETPGLPNTGSGPQTPGTSLGYIAAGALVVIGSGYAIRRGALVTR